MSKRTKIILATILASVSAVAVFILITAHDAGEFKSLVFRPPQNCRVVTGVLGSEDITVHPGLGLAFISSCDFRTLFAGKKSPRGAVFGYDLAGPEPVLTDLTADFPADFHPHGLGLHTAPTGEISLFVVNHRTDGKFVEIFDVRDKRLVHRRSVSGTLLVSPNDVIPVGPDRFYVTNDHGSASETGRTLEDFFKSRKAGVLYFDGDKFIPVAGGLAYANGINISPDGRTVYVAETTGRRLDVFSRDVDSGALTLRKTLDIGSGVDNLDVDPEGNIWAAAHPKLLTFLRYSLNQAALAPSQIFKISPGPDDRFRIEEKYLSDGGDLSGASVGARYGGLLLLGSVFDDIFLVCPD
ncbi:MAG: SMP-30/gluconolactonase/LRE family protein [Pseudomonadota bacterium]